MGTIPVHVILVHPPGQAEGTGVNFSLAHVQSQIDVINQDFGRYNSDASNTPGVFPAADTGIQFCLATVDPDGNPTDGITRFGTTTSMANSSGRTEVISQTRWPRESYMNIWSAPDLPFLGLASVPGTGGLPSANSDFILVESGTFGGPGFGTSSPYDLGRTTTHEVGHWLGLLHIWGPGNGSCNSDDGFDDTPNQTGSNFGCPNHPSPTCNNGGDMFMNYMDYVNDNCMNAFTVEQGEYMNTILNTSRAGLTGASSTNCSTVIPLEISVLSQTDPSCADIEDGSILVSASGGTPPYSYSIDGGPSGSTDFFMNLAGGAHLVQVFDDNGNTDMADVFLNTPAILEGSVVIDQINDCPADENGQITITGVGGTPPYFYSLNSGSTQSSGIFDELASGTYAYQIFDVNGCSFQETVELEGSTEITIEITETNNIICAGDNNGTVSGQATGGSGPLMYSIDGETYGSSSGFEDLSEGAYFFYAQDMNGCYDSIPFEITSPPALDVEIEATDITCSGENNGALTITAAGGNGSPYIYTLNGEIIQSTVENLTVGTYDLIVTDVSGCEASTSFSIAEPSELVMTTEATDVSCFGDEDGSISLVATGGTEPYSYSLSGIESTTGVYTSLAAGTYQAIITDANDCTTDLTIQLAVASNITAEVAQLTAVSCNGLSDGSVLITSSNTSGTVTYTLEGGTPTTDPLFSNLPPGDYLASVSDDSGCGAAVFFTIEEPAALAISSQVVDNVSCNGLEDGSISIVASGGTAPYTYDINPGGAQDNLAAGTYTLSVIDANGCSLTSTFTITEPTGLTLSVNNVFGASCPDGSNGRVTLGASGGAGTGYIYTLSGPAGTFSSTIGLFTDLTYGTYVASVVDANGCTGETSVTVTYENGFSAQILNVQDILCFSESGGSLDLEITGGMGMTSFLLDGAIEVDPTNLNTEAGDHTITVSDENQCMIELFFTLEEPEVLEFDFVVSGSILTINPSGGVQPYTYSYDGGLMFVDQNTYVIDGDTEVDVVVVDANGCEVVELVLISSVSDLTQGWTISSFPNPVVDQLTVMLDFEETTEVALEMIDISGKSVIQIPSAAYQAGIHYVPMDLTNLPGSVYFIKISSTKGARYLKTTKI